MSKVIMAVGVPGSGKTTVLRPLAERCGYIYLCADDIRAELTGEPANQTISQVAWDILRERLVNFLAQGKTIVVDATFAIATERRAFIAFARAHGATTVYGVFAAVPLETALSRNKTRERVVPVHVIRRLYTALAKKPPIVADGFDAVFDINELQTQPYI